MLSRELRLALGTPFAWLLVVVCAIVAYLTTSAHVAASFALCAALPFAVARATCDHGTTRALLQLGRAPLLVTASRFIASCVVAALLLAPGLVAAAVRAPADTGAVAALAIGAACTSVAVIGIGLAASSLAATWPAAALATLVVTCGAWALDAARAPLSFAMPTAALRIFVYGLVDVKDVVTLVGGGVGLALAATALLPRTAPVEARAVRAGAALVVTLIVCGAASQIRLSADLTRAQRMSFPPSWVAALSQVGDRVEVTLHARRDDARVDAIEQRVLVPLRRYVKVRTRFADDRTGSDSGNLITWRVGGREARLTDEAAVDAQRAVRTVLELAGVTLAR